MTFFVVQGKICFVLFIISRALFDYRRIWLLLILPITLVITSDTYAFNLCALSVTSRHQKKAQAQVNLLGLTGKMQSTKEEVVSKRRRTVTRSTKESSGGGSINEADEEDDEEVNMSTVGDDEDDVEEVLLENIEMDMEDTGKTKPQHSSICKDHTAACKCLLSQSKVLCA